jgi:hypothetical protein
MPTPLDSCFLAWPRDAAFSKSVHGRKRAFPGFFYFASLLLFAGCTACGAVGPSPALPAPAPAPVTVTVTSNSTFTYPNDPVEFTAVVQNAQNQTVTWQVNGTPSGSPSFGTIDPTGHYTAPNTVPDPPMVKVTAVLQSDPTKTGAASVMILSLSSVTGQLIVSPALSSVTTTQNLQLQILTPGVTNTNVTWAATGGTITPGGLFIPPANPGPYTVVASLPNAQGSATVEVTDFAGTLTWRNDNLRSGINSRELALTPGNVSLKTFGKLFSCNIDGYAYAQPLYVPNFPIQGGVHNVIFVATEKDSVFAFDADANPCVQFWVRPLIPTGSQAIETPNFQITSDNIAPFVGITGTPVISLDTSSLYVVAATETILPLPGTSDPGYSSLLYALDLATGTPVIRPSGVATFVQPTLENQRSALLLDSANVYVGFGSYGGQGDYHGWLLGYDATTLQPTGTFNVTPDSLQGGIWQSGGGPSADPTDPNHFVFLSTGDGAFNGYRGLQSYSNSFLRLGTAGGLSVADYFTPCDEPTLETGGLDVGASALLLLPESAGSTTQPHLLIGGSKAGTLYVVNRDQMGKYSAAPPAPPQCSDAAVGVQTVPVGNGPILSTPLFWNNAVYIAPGNGNLMSFPMTAGVLGTSPSATNSNEKLGPQGATPVLSANGANNAILWLIDSSGAAAGMPAILRAYDANNLSNEIYSSPASASSPDAAGPAVKFTVPTVANGKVYVGTQTELDVYGLK